MHLRDIVERRIPASPWAEGENIPWDDPGFSKRMLAEHLSQEHNLASRCFAIIDRQVGWIHEEILEGRPTRILDLGCGPGLYTGRLARLGHACVGIDFAPEPIRHAQQAAADEGLHCEYRLADVRETDFGGGYGLVMMLFGQLNVFRRRDACTLLEKAFTALRPAGLLLLEPQRFGTVEKNGQAGTSWYTCGEGGGLFSDRPHLCLSESFWGADQQSATQRFYIIDGETGGVARHAMTTQAYTDEQLRELPAQAGFTDIRCYPSLVGVAVEEESQAANMVIIARKPVEPVGEAVIET